MAARTTDDTSPEHQVLTIPEVAHELRASEWLTRELIRTNQLGHVRLGRLIRVTKIQLDAFLNGTARR